jgi:hypothetical protein
MRFFQILAELAEVRAEARTVADDLQRLITELKRKLDQSQS